MKKSMNYTNVDDIDARIAQINYKMQHESISLKQEKDFMAEIKELNKDKPKLSSVANLASKVQNLDAGTDLRAKRNELNEQFSILYEKKKAIQEKFKELQEKRSEQEGDLGSVREEKDAKQTKIRELIEQRNGLRDAFNEEKRKYKVFQDEQRRLRNERLAEQRKQEQEERRKRQLERQIEALDDEPYVDELARVDQCTRWCKSMLPQESGKKEEEKKETVHNNKDGEVVLLKKEDRDSEFNIPATKMKSKKGKKQGAADASKQKLTMNMDNFGDWAFLGLPPPMFVSDIPELLTKLEEKKKHFEDKVKDWAENKEEMKRKILDGTFNEDDVKGKEAEKEEEKEDEKEKEDADGDDYPDIKYGCPIP